jgi:hypothetical protein
LTRESRYHQAYERGLVPYNCPHRLTPNGDTILLTEIGITTKGEPCLYIFCRACRCSHPVTLKQLILSWQLGGYLSQEECEAWQAQVPPMEPRRRLPVSR